ncbi:MAG: hypothetical protein LBP87_02795 [Planctomycetaceae bacterium]|jgi:hypothetical protein|nr:hypothetical protein [Planctomycetaceae bacterium]
MTETLKQPKKWYQRKRFYGVVIWGVILVLLFYFCLVPSRLRISPETTYITEPLTIDGRIDYFAAFEKTYIDKLSPPENNGQRLLIAAFGPRVLEQNVLADTVSWEEMPTHEHSKNWFTNYWIPLCEHLYIDPYKKPMFYEQQGFYSYIIQYLKEQKKVAGETDNSDSEQDEYEKLFQKLTSVSWKKEDYPELGKWLDEYSEALDYVGLCVRKPNFACWKQKRLPEDSMIIALPDVQSNRDFARSLHVRISERVGRNDIEGAWYDVMTMKYLARHYLNDSILVTNMMGMVINNIANASAKLILIHCRPNEEQLAKFVSDSNNLPAFNPSGLSLKLERSFAFQVLQILKNGYRDSDRGIIDKDDSLHSYSEQKQIAEIFYLIAQLPFDTNIAGKHLTKFYGGLGSKNEEYFISNPVLFRQYAERLDNLSQQLRSKLNLKKQFYRILLIHTRSELLAECIFAHFMPRAILMSNAFNRYEAQNEMLQLSIALERYKLANGKYPDKLDELVPKYIEMIPIDPYTGRTTFVYKLRDTLQEDGTKSEQPAETAKLESVELPNLPYILYSFGPNGKDDAGILPSKNAGIWFSKNQQDNLDYDIVF